MSSEVLWSKFPKLSVYFNHLPRTVFFSCMCAIHFDLTMNERKRNNFSFNFWKMQTQFSIIYHVTQLTCAQCTFSRQMNLNQGVRCPCPFTKHTKTSTTKNKPKIHYLTRNMMKTMHREYPENNNNKKEYRIICTRALQHTFGEQKNRDRK